jgi:preprotein translocase subunit SecG
MLLLLLVILIAIVSLFLILIIMVQNPKGGGLNSAFGGTQEAQKIMGAARSTDILENTTWVLGGALLVLTLLAGIIV